MPEAAPTRPLPAELLPLDRRAEVLAWIDAKKGRGARQAVAHFLPLLARPDALRVAARIKLWLDDSRARKAGGGAVGAATGVAASHRIESPPPAHPSPEVNVSRPATPPKKTAVVAAARREMEPLLDVLAEDFTRLSPLQLAEAQVTLAQHGVRACEPGAGVYVQSLGALQKAIDALHLARSAHQPPSDDAADLSSEEWAARVQGDAAVCQDDDLEVYVGEWLRRHRLSLANEGGVLRLRPAP